MRKQASIVVAVAGLALLAITASLEQTSFAGAASVPSTPLTQTTVPTLQPSAGSAKPIPLGSGSTVPLACTTVGGPITQDVVWTAAGSPYCVTTNLAVGPGVKLAIEPGTMVRFDPGRALLVDGTLVARGTEANPIIFTSNLPSPAKGDWAYILFTNSSTDAAFDANGSYVGGSIVQHSVVEYAGSLDSPLSAALQIEASSPFVDHSTIRNNKGDGIRVYGGAPRITNNIVTDNGVPPLPYQPPMDVSGISVTASTALGASAPTTISGNTVSNNIGNGISVQSGTLPGTGTFVIDGNTVSNNTGGGISAIDTTSTVSGNVVTANAGGIATSGTSTISGNTVTANASGGINVTGTATLQGNTVSGNTGRGISVLGATATIKGNTVTGNTNTTPVAGIYGPGGGIYVGYSGGTRIEGNTITGNIAPSGGGIYFVDSCGGPTSVTRNVITGNAATQAHGGGGIRLCSSEVPVISYNELRDNLAGSPATPNDLRNGSASVNAERNWWGTTDPIAIGDHIWDFYDETGLGVVDFIPFLTGPVRTVYLPVIVLDHRQ